MPPSVLVIAGDSSALRVVCEQPPIFQCQCVIVLLDTPGEDLLSSSFPTQALFTLVFITCFPERSLGVENNITPLSIGQG